MCASLPPSQATACRPPLISQCSPFPSGSQQTWRKVRSPSTLDMKAIATDPSSDSDTPHTSDDSDGPSCPDNVDVHMPPLCMARFPQLAFAHVQPPPPNPGTHVREALVAQAGN
jgi:hypothetical protein